MRTLRDPVLVSFLVALCGCQQCPPTPTPPPPFRCTTTAQCDSSDTCDSDIEVCHGACLPNQVPDQPAGFPLQCLDDSGPGHPCGRDADCDRGYVCRTLADASNELAPYTVCIAEVEIVAGKSCPQSCADMNPSPAIDARCVDLVNTDGTKTDSICAARCYASAGNGEMHGPVTCRLDQAPIITSSSGGVDACQCESQDPYGTACDTAGRSCPGNLANPWFGDNRICEAIDPGKLVCVDLGFCRPETLETCANGIDEDCDGVPENDETECQVLWCNDHDNDGYCTDDCFNGYVNGSFAGAKKAGDCKDLRETPLCDMADTSVPDAHGNDCIVCRSDVKQCTQSGDGQNCMACPAGQQCNLDFQICITPSQ